MIELENGYQIAVDELNNTLQKKSVSKDGNVSVRVLGYYTNLESAITAYWRIAVAKKLNEDVFTLKEAVEILKSERTRIEELLK